MWQIGLQVVGVITFGVVCALAWCATWLSMPGNWMIVGVAGVVAWGIRPSTPFDIHQGTVLVLALLAVAGEVLETLTGAAGTAKLGGSRRGMMLSVLGAVVGSILGVGVGLPVPLVGSALAAVFGGAFGAFAGAVVGEHWKGAPTDQRWEVGRAAFLGRLAGTAAKLVVGAIMCVVAVAAVILPAI